MMLELLTVHFVWLSEDDWPLNIASNHLESRVVYSYLDGNGSTVHLHLCRCFSVHAVCLKFWTDSTRSSDCDQSKASHSNSWLLSFCVHHLFLGFSRSYVCLLSPQTVPIFRRWTGLQFSGAIIPEGRQTFGRFAVTTDVIDILSVSRHTGFHRRGMIVMEIEFERTHEMW